MPHYLRYIAVTKYHGLEKNLSVNTHAKENTNEEENTIEASRKILPPSRSFPDDLAPTVERPCLPNRQQRHGYRERDGKI